MTNKDIIALVEKNLLEFLDENKLELVDIDYIKEGPNWYLKIFIDKENGINIEDCELVNRFIGKKLDDLDPIQNPYILEVSSPGLDRQLKKDKDFEKFKNKLIYIKLFKQFDGKKEYIGILQSLKDNIVTIDCEGTILGFNQKDIALCKLEVVF